MSQSQNIEEIMQRIRAQVRKPEPSGGGKAAVPHPTQSLAEILQRIRVNAPGTRAFNPAESSRETMPESMPPIRLQLHELSPLRGETATALEGNRSTGQLNPRHPGLINNALQVYKKVMRRSLTWYTRPIHVFQAAVIRALQQIIAILENFREALQSLAEHSNRQSETVEQTVGQLSARIESQAAELESQNYALQQLSQRTDTALASYDAKLQSALREFAERNAKQIEALQTELLGQRNAVESLSRQVGQVSTHQRVRERDVRRLVHAIEHGDLPLARAESSAATPMFPSEIKGEGAFDYFVFEDRYRGDEPDIRRRQQSYLEYFRGRDNVVDIGCGRGEFLELLRDNGISGRGVELGTDQYLLCKEKGLDVMQQDLFEFLESLPDGSLGGIFSAQVIEHMTAGDQLRYVTLAYRKTMPGSPVILETINPECVYALARNFFLDPTHVRPVHPETLRFAMESAQFRNVELSFSGAATDQQIPPLSLNGDSGSLREFNAAIQRLNHFLYGYQDYAAIGWR
jgi:O-antigen chain-terminating methyltransferase